MSYPDNYCTSNYYNTHIVMCYNNYMIIIIKFLVWVSGYSYALFNFTKSFMSCAIGVGISNLLLPEVRNHLIQLCKPYV